MAEHFNGISVTHSNMSKANGQLSSVTIRNNDGQIIVRVKSDESKLIQKMRLHLNHPQRLEAIAAMRQHNVPEETIVAVLAKKGRK